MSEIKKISGLTIGLLIILIGTIARILLQNANASGMLVDVARLAVIVGIVVIIVGFFKRKKK